MTQHFLVYFQSGTDEVVAVYTNNEGKPITRPVLESIDNDLDMQEFHIETSGYITPNNMFKHIISTNGVVSFRPEIGAGGMPIARIQRKTILKRGPLA